MDSYTYERPYHDERAAKRDKQQCRLLVIAAIMLIAGACVARSVYEERASNAVDNRSRMFAFKIGNLDGNETESGTVFIQTRPDWAPLGAERFHDLVEADFFIGCRFYHAIPELLVQFGANGDPKVDAKWSDETFEDEPLLAESNVRGAIAFAVAGEDSRTTQLVIHTGNNDFLDHSGYVPFGRVVRGMDYIDQVYSKWGELPQEKRIVEEGNQYLYEKFPGLSYILNATPALE